MNELIEQLKDFILKEIKNSYVHMYEYDYKNSMHVIYHGQVLAYQETLRYLTSITTEVKEKEVK